MEKEKTFNQEYSENENLFGDPYNEFQDYFIKRTKKGSALDIGCGQGRDSIFLAKLGYNVTSIDPSEVGITQLDNTANELNLKISGIVGDAFNQEFKQKFDLILFDMLLHGFNKEQQQKLLSKYSELLNNEGIICIVFPEDIKKENFLDILNSQNHTWELLGEIIINDVPKINGEDIDFKFIMITVKIIN